MRFLPHIQSRIFNTPLAIQPEKLDVILTAIGPRIGLELTAEQIEAASKGFAGVDRKAYSVTKDGIAVIPIQGSLMKKASGLFAASGCASYEQISAQVSDAVASPNVKGIMLDIDSPGGETHGLFDLADMIYSCRGQKPLYAISNDGCYSAAYAIASCADRIFVTRTGGVGSIGVYSCHIDQSGADAKEGLKYQYIKAGAKKTEGNPHEPLTKSALEDAQAEVDREYQMFVSLVARNRAKSVESIINTEAGVFFAENAIPLLADEIGTFDDAMAALTEVVKGGTSTTLPIQKLTGGRKATINTNSSEEIERMSKKAKLEQVKAQADAELNVKLAEVAAEEPEVEKADEEYMEDVDEQKCEDINVADATQAKVDPDDDGDDDEDGSDDDTDEENDKKQAVALTRIVNLCTLAGHSDLAASFINSGMTVKQVEKALLEKRVMKSTQTKVSNSLPTQSSAFDQLNAGRNGSAREYEAFLRKNAATYQNYMEERNEATATDKGARQYLAEMKTKISARG